MSICLILFGGLGGPNLYHDLVYFTGIGGFTWRVSDSEELVGVTHRSCDGWYLIDRIVYSNV